MKNLIRFLAIIFLLLVNNTYALNDVWDLNTDTEYNLSDSNTTIISGGYGQLKMQLNHAGTITNGAGGASLNNPEGIIVDGNYAYVASASSDSIEIIDISDPTNPIHLSKISNGNGGARLDDPRALIKNGNYLYVASYRSDSLEVIDISNPSNPTHVTSINDGGSTYLNGAIGLTIDGNYLFVTAYVDDALEILDISTPSAPTHIGSIRNSGNLNGAKSVAISGNYAYVTSDRDDSFQIIDISTISSPSLVTEITNGAALLDSPRSVKILGNYAYIVSANSDALVVIDISNPNSPSHVINLVNGGSVNLDGARDIIIEGNYAYITTHEGDAVQVVDISNPTNPVGITNIVDAGSMELNGATTIYKVGNYLYVGSRLDDGVEILKITYTTTSPNIIPTNNLLYSGSIDKLTTTFSLNNEGTVNYQISKDNGTTWYYLNGTTRTPTTVGVLESNTEPEINSEIQSFNGLSGGTGEFLWKVFLNSNGNQKVEIDEIKIDFTTAGINEIIDFETPGGYTVTNGTWTRQTTEFYEGTYAIEANNGGNDNTTSCFNVNRDIYNDSTISFYRKISSEAGYDFLRFYIDGSKIEEWAGNIARGSGTYDISNGNHDFKWCYEKDGSVANGSDTAWIDYIEIKEIPLPPVEIVVLDFEISGGYSITTSVTAEDWFRQSTTVYEGSYAIQSADITDNQNVCFERVQEVTSLDTGISFYRKVDSESGYDFLRFYIDGTEQDKWAGNINWTKQVYTLSPATYTLKWCYSKDGSVSNGADAAYVDLVSVTQDPPVISEIISVATPTNDNTPDYTFNTPIAGDISYGGSCSSTSNTTAVLGDNTITFDALPDGIYTDCTIQVLASPQDTTILDVSNFTVDTTGIDITFNNPTDGGTIAPAGFDIDLSYSDDNGVDTSTIILKLFEWDGSTYGPDIAADFVDFAGATVTSSSAVYSTLALTGSTQYKIEFSIDDTTGNNSVGTSVFNVSSGDTTAPNIINNFPLIGTLQPNTNFDIDIDYTDSESTINTGSIVVDIKKWDGSAWGTDISGTYITGNNISTSNATYNISKLGFGKYKVYFYIEDSVGNGDSISIEFYIDEPEFIISNGSLDIGEISNGISKFSSSELNITVKTVGAGFDIVLNKDQLLKGSIEINDWNGTSGVGYDKNPYTSTINLINTNEIIATQTGSINTDGNKNTYTYSIKLGALVSEEQEAGEYSSGIKFGIILDY